MSFLQWGIQKKRTRDLRCNLISAKYRGMITGLFLQVPQFLIEARVLLAFLTTWTHWDFIYLIFSVTACGMCCCGIFVTAESIIWTKGKNPAEFQLYHLNVFPLQVFCFIVVSRISFSDPFILGEVHKLTCYMMYDFTIWITETIEYRQLIISLWAIIFSGVFFAFVMKSLFLKGKILRWYSFYSWESPTLFFIIFSLKPMFWLIFFTRCSKISTISFCLHRIWPRD